jgi:hypothetical protein
VLAAFWSGLGGELAKHWAARILTPAFVFWTAGPAAVWWSEHRDDVRDHGWTAQLKATAHPLEQLPAVAQIVLVLGALMLLVGSALVAERLTLPLLKLLEGYWERPGWLRGLLVSYRRWRRRRWAAKVEPLRVKQARGDLSRAEQAELRGLQAEDQLDEAQLDRLQHLSERERHFSATQMARLARGEAFLRVTPGEDALGMPTRLGDVLRAAERRPYDKYGLDAVVCWYRLWMVLPVDVKTEITEARLELDRAVRTCLWGTLFLAWAPWLWWAAVPIGLLVPLLTYNFSMLSAAALFGDLVETSFDLHRMALYDALHLPRPTSAADERGRGARLTGSLWHGEADPAVVYVAPAPPTAG